LGATGPRVSPLGLGTVKFGRNRGINYPRAFELPSDREALALLDLAWDLGINLLGHRAGLRRERRATGPAAAAMPAGLGDRDQGRRGVPRRSFTLRFLRRAIRASVERSLRRLGVDALDAVLIHSSGDDLAILEGDAVLPTLLDLKQAGLARAVGMSTKTVAGGLRAVECCDLVMVTYNLRQREELPVIRAAHAANKGVLIKKGLLSGHLDRTTASDPVLASLRLIYAEPGVSSVVVGTLNPAHLRANAAAVESVLGR
jgi:Predicted oxidoreductases (related to aryl-alcohol dehydrogenases)